MGEIFVSMAGTPQGEVLALFLALMSALAHAIFAAVNKGGVDPYLNRGAINVAYSLMAAPFALFVFPLPGEQLIPLLFFSFLLHIAYEWFQAAAFSRGSFTLVYLIARGIGPVVTALLHCLFSAKPWFLVSGRDYYSYLEQFSRLPSSTLARPN